MKIILFYKYIDLDSPRAVMKSQRKLCESFALKGRIIIATEGINGTLGGTEENIDQYIAAMRESPLFNDIDFKESIGVFDHFPRLRIVVKKEIVYLGIAPELLKARDGGKHLDPAQAHALMAEKPDNLVIIDCRNAFESNIGTFEGALRPQVTNFRDFPAYIDQNIDLFKDKQVLMACTGGIRCERGSAYVKSKGIAKEVFQIKGGIHRYVEQFPNGFFKGKNYVFDGRIAVRVTNDVLATCSICKTHSDDYFNCMNAACNKQFISCADCLQQYQNMCSTVCYELVYVQGMPKRPERKKVYSQGSSCGV